MAVPRSLVRLAARAKRHVPEPAWPLLLSLRSVAGGGPLVAPPGAQRALVLAPHPDDESVGCGGTVATLVDAGAAVTVAFATDGERTVGSTETEPVTGAARRAEADVACALLGATPRFLGLGDGRLAQHLDALAADVAALAAELEPEVVLCPWPLDGHPDHAAVARAVAAAARRAPGSFPAGTEVWGYETWTPLPATRLVDVTAVIGLKEEALAAHATAHQAFDVRAMVGLNRYRSVHGLMGRGYAEAFLTTPSPQAWADLVDELGTLGAFG